MGGISDRQRVWVLLFTALGVVALVFLAAGLSELELLPGKPHPILDLLGDLLRAIFGAIPDGQAFGSLYVVLIWVAMLLLIVLLFFLIFMPRTKSQGSRW
ncbi:MAG: hypothetical protein P8189_13555, partial [Anaerolineae bacterium]